MIDRDLVKAELNQVTARAERRFEAEQWGTGEFDDPPFDLLPDLPAKARAEARKHAAQVQSLGPRVVSLKKYLTLGRVNWGGNNKTFDELMRAQNLEAAADEMLEQALYSGWIVGITRRHPRKVRDDNGKEQIEAGLPHIEPLSGHTEPLYDAENPNRIAGVFQAWRPLDVREKGWRVRIYDLDQRTMSEWHKLEQPYEVGKNPTIGPIPNAPMPRFEILRRGRGRLPLGDLEIALPLLKSDWSSQIRGDRAELQTAFSQMIIAGQVEEGTDEKRSPAHVIRVHEGGDVKYLVPGDLTQIHNHHDRKLERLRRDLNLPGGVLAGSNISGEALREDNMHAIADSKHKAEALGRVLTALAQDFVREHQLSNVQDVQVTVEINKEFEAATHVERIISLYREELIERGAAIRAIAAYVPTWEDEKIEAYIKATAEVIPPDPKPTDTAEQATE